MKVNYFKTDKYLLPIINFYRFMFTFDSSSIIESKNKRIMTKYYYKSQLQYIIQQMITNHVKIESVESTHLQLFHTNTPFQINHGQNQIKPQFIPYSGHWTNFQNAKYCAFVQHFRHIMQSRPHSSLWELYKEMSRFVQSRNFRQCKNYHKKLCQQFSTIPKIIEYFSSAIQNFGCLLSMEKQRIQKFKLQKNFDVKNIPVNKNLKNELNVGHLNIPTQLKYKTGDRYTADRYLTDNLFPMVRREIPYYPNMQANKTRQSQWLECHNLFLAWTSRLAQLNQMNFRP